METVLINSDKYSGKYVAIKSVEDHTIVGAGNTPDKALKQAKNKGIPNPFLLYVPDKDIVQIYHVG